MTSLKKKSSISHLDANKDSSCIVQCNKKLQVLVPPLYCNNLGKGVIVALNQLMKGYCKKLGGLVIGYKDVKLYEGTGFIHSTNPFIHVHISATFDVFVPTQGLCIEGVVNEVSNNKVSFLAYNKFNVVYRTQEVRNKLTHASKTKKASAEASRVVLAHHEKITKDLKEGDTCTLLLHEVSLWDFLPHLRGYPVPKGMDTSSLLRDDAEQALPISNSLITDGAANRKVRFSDQESESSDVADSSVREVQLLTPPTSHGEHTSASDEESLPTVLPDPPSSGKKKKKNKKVKHEEVISTTIKQETVSPSSRSIREGVGQREHDSDESLEDEVAVLPPPPPPPQSKKKKKNKRLSHVDGAACPVDVKTLQKMIESCVLPEPVADDSEDYLSRDMIAVKQEILEVAEGRSTKSKKRKSCADSEQTDIVEVLKPSKKKRKLNS